MDSSTRLDVEYEIEDGAGEDDGLTFQDIPHSSEDLSSGKSKTHEFTNFPHSAMDSDEEVDEDSAKLLNEDTAPPASSSSFWTFAYYQQFFDVETTQVGMRIIGSMFPKPGSNYLVKEIRPKPDLYGPFWICTTLVFTTAIAGNLANYFSSAGKDYHWKYDFHKVTFAAATIYSYWWFIPLILYALLWWRGSRDRFSFLEIICAYGYSLAIYIPISILWAIQVSWLQWTLVLVGAVLSGSVLLMNFWNVVSEDNKKIALGIMTFIFIMHAALAAGFVLYFFHVSTPPQSAPTTPATNTTAKPLNANLKIPEGHNNVPGVIPKQVPDLSKGTDGTRDARITKAAADAKSPSGAPVVPDNTPTVNVRETGKVQILPVNPNTDNANLKPTRAAASSTGDVQQPTNGKRKRSSATA